MTNPPKKSWQGSVEKSRLISGIARKWEGVGGFTHAQMFWPFFHQVKVPEIGTFLLNSHNICMFLVIFYHFIIIKITIITIMIIIAIIIN